MRSLRCRRCSFKPSSSWSSPVSSPSASPASSPAAAPQAVVAAARSSRLRCRRAAASAAVLHARWRILSGHPRRAVCCKSSPVIQSFLGFLKTSDEDLVWTIQRRRAEPRLD